MIVPFVGQTYQMEAVSFDHQRCVNLYPIVSESGTSRTVTALRGTSGLVQFATAGGGGIRGGIESQGRAFFVSGSEFYEVHNNGTTTNHGALDTATSRVQMAENPTQIIITDETYGYIFNKVTDTFTKITDVDFPVPSSLTFQDGYFLVSEANSSKFWISNINNGLVWDSADNTTVEGSPDYLVAIKSDKSNIWCFGTKSVEIYRNTGNATFPFQKLAGAYIETGCAAANTIQIIDNALVWLGSDENGDKIVWRANGYSATRISTQAIERKIAEGRNLSESYAWVYHERGHAFYVLQIAGLNTTLVYDLSTGAWHERVYRNTSTGAEEKHRGAVHVFAFNKHLIGDRETNQIYDMSLEYYSDDGDPIVRKRISPYYAQEKEYIDHAQFELDMEVGVGLQSGQGSDPKIMMRYSDDGRNWSDELWRDIGKVGEYSQRVLWRQLGRARQRVYSVEISDPVFVQINGAYLNGS